MNEALELIDYVNECIDRKAARLSEAIENHFKLELAYSAEKKLLVRPLGCKKCELNDWRF